MRECCSPCGKEQPKLRTPNRSEGSLDYVHVTLLYTGTFLLLHNSWPAQLCTSLRRQPLFPTSILLCNCPTLSQNRNVWHARLIVYLSGHFVCRGVHFVEGSLQSLCTVSCPLMHLIYALAVASCSLVTRYIRIIVCVSADSMCSTPTGNRPWVWRSHQSSTTTLCVPPETFYAETQLWFGHWIQLRACVQMYVHMHICTYIDICIIYRYVHDFIVWCINCKNVSTACNALIAVKSWVAREVHAKRCL